MKTAAILVSLILSQLCLGQEVKAPDEVKTKTGRVFQIVIETEDKDCKYKSLSDSLTIWREYPPPNSKPTWIYLRGIAYENGSFYLVSFSAKGDKASELAVTKVTVGESPKPPSPVDPDVPPTPKPDSADIQKIKSAYDKEVDSVKKEFAIFYANLLSLSADSKGLVFDQSYKTASEILKAMQDARKKIYESDFLMTGFRDAVGDCLRGLPTGELNEANRKTIAAKFLAVAEAIREAIK